MTLVREDRVEHTSGGPVVAHAGVLSGSATVNAHTVGTSGGANSSTAGVRPGPGPLSFADVLKAKKRAQGQQQTTAHVPTQPHAGSANGTGSTAPATAATGVAAAGDLKTQGSTATAGKTRNALNAIMLWLHSVPLDHSHPVLIFRLLHV